MGDDVGDFGSVRLNRDCRVVSGLPRYPYSGARAHLTGLPFQPRLRVDIDIIRPIWSSNSRRLAQKRAIVAKPLTQDGAEFHIFGNVVKLGSPRPTYLL